MKNKIKFLILFIAVMFISVISVNAEATVCEYDKINLTVTFDEGGTSTINQDFYPKQETPWWISWLVNHSSGNIDETKDLEFQEKELFGSCPSKIYTCKYEEWSVNTGIKRLLNKEAGRFLHLSKVYLFYSENEMKDNKELAKVENTGEWDVTSDYITSAIEGFKACSGFDIPVVDLLSGVFCFGLNGGLTAGIKHWWELEEFAVKRKECSFAEYTGDLPSYNLACPNLNVYIGRFNDALNQYKACSKTDAACISKTLTNVNEKETLIKNYCKSILKEQDFDGGVEEDCIEACLNNVDQTIKAKKDAGLLSEDDGDCGFSQRLGVWLLNIFRWIKYILPVLVIVLGILDFIKAIGSDKEDEMKKAQKSFIIRLIAAALVFIVPLILEFVLIKMGFSEYVSGCEMFYSK